jgi:hypothetical protein
VEKMEDFLNFNVDVDEYVEILKISQFYFMKNLFPTLANLIQIKSEK